MSDVQEGAQEEQKADEAQEQPAEATTAKGKSKVKPTGNLIADTAAEVESLSKSKALNLADSLSLNVEANQFKLGGVLKVISDNGWFEGYDGFGAFVLERFGFQERKARYLMQIYTDLVTRQIPWDKVAGLGWTKLKDLSPILTLDNLDEWVEKASSITVAELQTILKGNKPESDSAPKTTDEIVTLKYKVKHDQAETIQHAIAKAKGEIQTEYDTVAIENICALYLSGNAGALEVSGDLKQLMAGAGWKTALDVFGQLFPEIDVEVDLPEPAAGEQPAE